MHVVFAGGKVVVGEIKAHELTWQDAVSAEDIHQRAVLPVAVATERDLVSRSFAGNHPEAQAVGKGVATRDGYVD